MTFKLNFVYDKKSGDCIGPRFVSNHAVAVRDFVLMKDKPESKDALFVKFPDDYVLVTFPMEFLESGGLLVSGSGSFTEFRDILGGSND